MDSEELHNAIMTTASPCAALAALILASDHDGARHYARQMTHEDLVTIALVAAHMQSGSHLDILQRQLELQGHDPDDAAELARKTAIEHFQATARNHGSGQEN